MRKLVLILLCQLFAMSVAANEVDISRRLSLSVQDTGGYEFNNQYMTYYIARFIGEGGIGKPLYIKPNDKKVNFDIIDANLVNYSLTVKGKLPTFNSVKSTGNIANYTPSGGIKGAYDIDISGGNLLGYIGLIRQDDIDFIQDMVIGDESDHSIALLLNIWAFINHSISVFDSVATGGKVSNKAEVVAEKLQYLLGIIQKTEHLQKQASLFYQLSKVIGEEIKALAPVLGGVTNGVPNNKWLADTLAYYDNYIVIMDSISANTKLKLSGENATVNWQQKFQQASYNRLIKIDKSLDNFSSDTYRKALAKKYESIQASSQSDELKENSLARIVSDAIIAPANSLLTIYVKTLNERLKKSKDKNEKEELKLQIYTLVGVKTLIQMYRLSFEASQIYTLLKQDPAKGKEVLSSILYDMAEGVVGVIAADTGNLSLELINKIGGAENAAKANVYLKAFNGSKDFANKVLPFLSDFITAPTTIQSSLKDGDVQHLTPVNAKVIVVNGDSRMEYEELSEDETLNVFVDPDKPISMGLYLYRPDYFNAERSPWKLQTDFAPNTVYDASINVTTHIYERKILCAKKIIGNEEYVSYHLLRNSAGTFSGGQCDAGELGAVDGKWFDGDITKIHDDFIAYDHDSDIKSVLKLQEYDAPLLNASSFQLAKANRPVQVLFSGYDLNNHSWKFNFYSKLTLSDVEIVNLTSDKAGALNKTFKVNVNLTPEDDVINYIWDFNDGSEQVNSTSNEISHTFTNPGFYNVNVRIETRLGQIVTQTYNIENEIDVLFSDLALAECIKKEIEVTGEMNLAELKSLDCSGLGIESSEGLSVLTGLESLNLNDNYIPWVNLKTFSSLKFLDVRSNKLIGLSLEGNPLLVSLYVANNKLRNLYLEQNPNLLTLKANKNPLTQATIDKLNANMNPLYSEWPERGFPELTSISPEVAPINIDTVFTITGINLPETMDVIIKGTNCTNKQYISSSLYTLTCKSNKSLTQQMFAFVDGSVDLDDRDIIWKGIKDINFKDNITVGELLDISPKRAAVGANTRFTITGNHFPTTMVAHIEGADCRNKELVSSSKYIMDCQHNEPASLVFEAYQQSGGALMPNETPTISFYNGTHIVDGFDYPLGNRGLVNGLPVAFPEHIKHELNSVYSLNRPLKDNHTRESHGATDLWRNVQDIGSFLDGWGIHSGEDWNLGSLNNDAGEEVYAIAEGTVISIKSSFTSSFNDGGWTIVLEHEMPSGDSLYSLYTHVTS